MNIISVFFLALTIQRIHVILLFFEWYFPEIFVPRKAAVFCPQDSRILRFAGSHLAPRSIWAWQIKLIKIGWNKVRHEEPTSWNIKINNIHSIQVEMKLVIVVFFTQLCWRLKDMPSSWLNCFFGGPIPSKDGGVWDHDGTNIVICDSCIFAKKKHPLCCDQSISLDLFFSCCQI